MRQDATVLRRDATLLRHNATFLSAFVTHRKNDLRQIICDFLTLRNRVGVARSAHSLPWRVEKRVFLRFESKDSHILDTAVHRITGELLEAGITMQGPFPLPTRHEWYTIITSNVRRTHRRDTHKRLAILVNTNPSALTPVSSSGIPAGVLISLRAKSVTIMQVGQR